MHNTHAFPHIKTSSAQVQKTKVTNLSVRSRSCDSVPDDDNRKGDVMRATDERAILSEVKCESFFPICSLQMFRKSLEMADCPFVVDVVKDNTSLESCLRQNSRRQVHAREIKIDMNCHILTALKPIKKPQNFNCPKY